MDLFSLSDFYLNRIIGGKDNKVKVLLLDSKTTSIISLNSTQSELLQNDIYLINKIDNHQRDKLRHLNCIAYLTPSEESINHLLLELRNPKYGKYEIYFNNSVTKTQLERLAESDDLEVVVKVEEIFQDYYTINKELYQLNLSGVYGETSSSWNSNALNSSIKSLTSLLLSFKLKPIIRYESNSRLSSKLSKELIYQIEHNEQLFDFKLKDSPPLLLILDRKNDPITPLLQPWTYQSMIHELIGIENNTVTIEGEDFQEEQFVLSSRHDQFFKDSMYLNFGDLSDKLKNLVEQLKLKTNSSKKIESIDDMKKFIEEFPELKKFSGDVNKHMALASKLNTIINRDKLWDVSELEQNISSHDQQNADTQELDKLINDVAILADYKVKLLTLYALKYESSANLQIKNWKTVLINQGTSLEKINTIDIILKLSGTSKRLDEEQSIFDKAASNIISGFKNNNNSSTDNIYMQHVPRLENILNKVIRGKLSEINYPILSPYKNNEYLTNSLHLEKSQDIVVFIIGGVTYEEARIVNSLNRLNKGVRIVVGGTTIHNSSSFINEVTSVKSVYS